MTDLKNVNQSYQADAINCRNRHDTINRNAILGIAPKRRGHKQEHASQQQATNLLEISLSSRQD